jgi:hypothetical protein
MPAQPPRRTPVTPPTGYGVPAPPSPATPDAPRSAAETLRPEDVYGDGSNAAEALAAILGDRVTGDIEADCAAAIRAIDEWQRELPRRRALILHLLHAWYYRQPTEDPTDRNVWMRVARRVGRAYTTVHDWAHAAPVNH